MGSGTSMLKFIYDEAKCYLVWAWIAIGGGILLLIAIIVGKERNDLFY